MTLAKTRALAKVTVKAALAAQDNDETQDELVKHFGTDATVILNNYACALEDVVLQLTGDLKSMREEFSLTYDVDHSDTQAEEMSDAW